MPPGNDAAELLRLGYVRSVGVPITVAGATWGALVVVLREDATLPIATEHRLAAFAELVALAVASAHARDELAASRLRLERNLHDGAQQRRSSRSRSGSGSCRRSCAPTRTRRTRS